MRAFRSFSRQVAPRTAFASRVGPTMGASPSHGAFLSFVRWCATRNDIRNVAVIAHVDHGKTTLVDAMLKQSGTLKEAKNRIMDSKDQEKERGITILAKNTSIVLQDLNARINIVDTPGHLDFSGEVERALQMVEGFILLVDANESVKPGTRYVLRKALALGLRPIVVLNKIDRADVKLEKTENDIQDLFLDIATTDDQLDIFFMYGSGRDGYVNETPLKEGTLRPLFDQILKRIPPPEQRRADGLQLLVSSIAPDEGGDRVAIGRVFSGSLCKDDVVSVICDEKEVNAMVKKIRLYEGVSMSEVNEARFGDVVCVTLKEPMEKKIPLEIGATLCSKDASHPWPYKKPDEPTFSLVVHPMKADWKGKEVKQTDLIVSNRLRAEAVVNTALKLADHGEGATLMMGRGPLHLGVIIEDMRREGYEFELSAPEVLKKNIDGVVHEPFERVSLEFKRSLAADVVSLLSQAHAEIGEMTDVANDRIVMDVVMAVRLMMDLPLKFNKLTMGDGVINHTFDGYRPESKISNFRQSGALISNDNGVVEGYSLTQLQKHGRFFVEPGDKVYYGQIIGENEGGVQNCDLAVNVTKKNEQQGGMRANAADAARKTKAAYRCQPLDLDTAIAWVKPGEMIAITPQSIRMRRPGFNGKTVNHGKKK